MKKRGLIKRILLAALSAAMAFTCFAGMAGCTLFGGGGGEEGTIDCRQWLEAVQNDTEPLVKPEEALAVTKVLDAIYKSAAENKEIKF